MSVIASTIYCGRPVYSLVFKGVFVGLLAQSRLCVAIEEREQQIALDVSPGYSIFILFL